MGASDPLCGLNGCGGTCGTCGEDEICTEGICEYDGPTCGELGLPDNINCDTYDGTDCTCLGCIDNGECTFLPAVHSLGIVGIDIPPRAKFKKTML